MKIKINMVDKSVCVPDYQTDGAAAMDLYSAESFLLRPGDRRIVSVGFAIEIPVGYVGEITPRSGKAILHGLSIVNSPGLIDSDYRGLVRVILINLGKSSVAINKNDRIAQMMIRRVERADLIQSDRLSDTKRGSGGFGSTKA